jgi:hypothetical protein
MATSSWYMKEKRYCARQTSGLWTLEGKRKTLGGFLSEELHEHFGTASARSFSAQT